MKPSFTTPFAVLIVVVALGCSTGHPEPDRLTSGEQLAIGDSIRSLLMNTYTFDGKDPVPRFMQLYADTGSVVSAASGGFTVSRDSVRKGLTTFWTTAGQYMQHPSWTWGTMKVDVLSRDAAVVTARYTIPHWTPEGRPHVLGGAWTSVWARRGGRWVIVHEHLSDLPRAVAERVEATMPASPPPATKR
jgi:ketosteroid isomerase-like protein